MINTQYAVYYTQYEYELDRTLGCELSTRRQQTQLLGLKSNQMLHYFDEIRTFTLHLVC